MAQTYLPARPYEVRPNILVDLSAIDQAQRALVPLPPLRDTPTAVLQPAEPIRLTRPQPMTPEVTSLPASSPASQSLRKLPTPPQTHKEMPSMGIESVQPVEAPLRPSVTRPLVEEGVTRSSVQPARVPSPNMTRSTPADQSDTKTELSLASQQIAQQPKSYSDEIPRQIMFASETADLKDSDKIALDIVASKLKNANQGRVQLLAFADGTPQESSKARRLSLARALAVRSYLMAQGVSAAMIDVRALGLGGSALPGSKEHAGLSRDRVDLKFIQ